jgi:hypothetical protein
MLKPGAVNRFQIPASQDGIDFMVGRMIKMIQEAKSDPLVIATARKISALTTSGRKIREGERDLIVLKGIHAWCKGHFEYVRDPVNTELIQTPNRMLRELEIPPQIHMLMWKPIAKVMKGTLPRPKITGDSDESSILSLSLAAAVGIEPLRIMLGGNDGAISYAWGAAYTAGRWWNLDIMTPGFNKYPKIDVIKNVGVDF